VTGEGPKARAAWGPRILTVALQLAVTALCGCLPPKALPLTGVLAPRTALPAGAHRLPVGYHRIRFRWHFRDPQYAVNGDGAARVAYPDSARLDFVVGHALLFGDTLVAPGGGGVRRYLPAIPLLWATLGRLAVPSAPDTIVRVQGDTVRADIGPTAPDSTVWRVAFLGGELTSLARLSGGRIRETVARDVERGRVRYDNSGAHRSLTLTQVRSEAVPAFDSLVWHP
jgi:hypothetical protein